MEFQSRLFNSTRALTSAIAESWITAGGQNSPIAIDRMIDNGLDADSAVAKMIETWEITTTWLADRGIDKADLIAAFQRFLDERPDIVDSLACGFWQFRAYNSETLYAATDRADLVDALLERLNRGRNVNLYDARKMTAQEIVKSGVYKMQNLMASQDTDIDDVA